MFTHVLTTWAKLSVQISKTNMSGVWNHLSPQVSSPPWDGLCSSSSTLGSSFTLGSPWEWNWLSYHTPWCPKMVSGQSHPLTHSNWDWQSLWWHCGPSDFSLLAAWCSFQKRNWFLYDFLGWPADGWHMLAVAVAGSQPDCHVVESGLRWSWWLKGPVHLP